MIDFRDVTISYARSDDPGRSDPPVLDQISLHIPEGDLCLVVGRTGVGKSTFLQSINGLVPHFSGGELTGDIIVAGRNTRTHRPRDLADVVGFVQQDPLLSFVTDKVEDEIAFGMEQLGLPPVAMRKRVEETLDLMGIAELRGRRLTQLSGGQQQRVAIAAVLAAQPRIIVLDEPTSALDPTAAGDVLAAITTLVHEVGLTLVLAEHRLERVMHVADSIAWLPGDGSVRFGPPAQILAECDVVPPLAALGRVIRWSEISTSVRDARRRVAAEQVTINPSTRLREADREQVRIQVDDLVVRYGRVLAVNQVSATFHAGEVTALMGRNGAGKSSLLWALQGAVPARGRIALDGRAVGEIPRDELTATVCLVPQNAADLLYLPTVDEELAQADAESQVPGGSTAALLADLGVELPGQRHPRDLSEGQRLGLVLGIQLVVRPAIVLLDEPTRGLDYATKTELARMVAELASRGACVIISTHDVEFAAAATSRCVIMAEGGIVADGPTREVLTSSPTFAPQMAKVFYPRAVLTPDEIARGSDDDR